MLTTAIFGVKVWFTALQICSPSGCYNLFLSSEPMTYDECIEGIYNASARVVDRFPDATVIVISLCKENIGE